VQKNDCKALCSKLSKVIYECSLPHLVELLQSTEAPKNFELILAKVLKEFLKLSDDFVMLIDTKFSSQDQAIASTCFDVVSDAIQFLKAFGLIFDFILFDSCKFEPIIVQF